LRALPPPQATTAIALAASQGAGLVTNFGTMTKSFHAGNAAHAGVLSARLAEAGFTASAQALEGPAGFLSTVPHHASAIDLESPLACGPDWSMLHQGLSIKKYPVCFAAHRALDAILGILEDHDVDPAGVARVHVVTSRRAAFMLAHAAPTTALEAKFSMHFAMACALLQGRVGLGELTDAFVARRDVQALMRRVHVEPTDSDDPARPGYALFDQVRIELEGRELLSERIDRVRGDADFPLAPEALWSKFESCIEASGSPVPARPLFDALMDLQRLSRAAALPGISKP
jgi:2-methylcitrate dehydratase PrpD